MSLTRHKTAISPAETESLAPASPENPPTPVFPRASAKIILILTFVAVLLTGLARVALLPPFAGEDEIYHYSRIEAIAFAAPKSIETFNALDAVACTRIGPMPYNWIFIEAFNGAFYEALHHGGRLKIKQHMQMQGYVNYRDFFSGKSSDIEKFERRCGKEPGRPVFEASSEENEEFQHPPTYYMLLAPALRLFSGAPVVTRLLALRSLNYLICFLGFAIGIVATLKHLEIRGHLNAGDVTVFGAFIPFLMPVFFDEFCRIGNDNLCLLLFSLMWALTLLYLRRPGEKALWAAIGVVSGYGWLVKATMIAVSTGLFLFMALQPPPENGGCSKIVKAWRRLLPAAAAGLTALLVGFTPYVPTGKNQVNGSYSLNAWIHGEGFLHPEAGIPWRFVFGDMFTLFTSTVYSFADVAPSFAAQAVNAVLPAILLAIAAGWAVSLPRDPRREEWLPLYAVLPLAGGIALYGVFAAIAYRVTGVTPGGRMHVLAPAFALIGGLGLVRWTSAHVGRVAAGAVLAVAAAGNAAIILLHVAMTTGCVWQSEAGLNLDSRGNACRLTGVFDRLQVLAWPEWGFFSLAAGAAALIAAVTFSLRHLWRR